MAKFSVGEVVYIVSSASLGYLDSYQVTQVAQQPNGLWYYRVSIPARPPTATNTMGDRNTRKQSFDIRYAENELTDVCTACTTAIAALQARLSQVQNVQTALCN